MKMRGDRKGLVKGSEVGPPIFSREYRCRSGEVPQIERDRIRDYIYESGVEITLNGEVATIGGYQLDYGSVGILPCGLRAEFAWQTIERIVRSGGAFKS